MYLNSFQIPNHPYLSEPLAVYDFSLNEDHIHYLWKNKAFNLAGSLLTSGKSFDIKDFGMHNTHQSGPDFSDCQIIIDNLNWYGKVEMHLKSSDWYLHKHQNDPAYNTVVLHVVWKHDREVYVNESPLPTLELQNWVDKTEFDRLVKFLSNKKELPCASQLSKVPFELIEQQLEKALEERIERKTSWIKTILKYSKSREQAIYSILGTAFGSKANNLAFSELLTRVPYEVLEKTNFEYNDILLHSVSDLVSGNDKEVRELNQNFLDLNSIYDLQTMKKSSWIFSGLRPPSFPSIRIEQFSRFIHSKTLEILLTSNLEISIESIRSIFKKDQENKRENYFETHYSWGKETAKPINSIPTDDFILGIILNAMLPLHYVLAEEKNDAIRKLKLDQMLEKLPAEKIKSIQWIKKYGISLKNASNSQSVLELNSEFCTPRRCLDCLIGKKLIS